VWLAGLLEGLARIWKVLFGTDRPAESTVMDTGVKPVEGERERLLRELGIHAPEDAHGS
jgi:hypothetical protein